MGYQSVQCLHGLPQALVREIHQEEVLDGQRFPVTSKCCNFNTLHFGLS